jgi:hypothetical protein
VSFSRNGDVAVRPVFPRVFCGGFFLALIAIVVETIISERRGGERTRGRRISGNGAGRGGGDNRSENNDARARAEIHARMGGKKWHGDWHWWWLASDSRR